MANAVEKKCWMCGKQELFIGEDHPMCMMCDIEHEELGEKEW